MQAQGVVFRHHGVTHPAAPPDGGLTVGALRILTMTHGGTLDDLGHRSNGGARDTGCCFTGVQNMTKVMLPPVCPSQALFSRNKLLSTKMGVDLLPSPFPKKNETASLLEEAFEREGEDKVGATES